MLTPIIIGLGIFIICTYAVYSHKIDDGFVGRHFLTFIAISAAGYAWSGNDRALMTIWVLVIGMALWMSLRQIWKGKHERA